MPTQRKILTVVLLSASAGCGASSPRAPTPAPTPTRVPVPAIAATSSVTDPMATVTVLANPSADLVIPATPPVIEPDHEQPESVMRLRSELYRADELTLSASHAKFRALCDENGYPVVGNVASKSMRHDVSSYCEDVREQLVMRTTTGPDA
jgi:hypothetical protein